MAQSGIITEVSKGLGAALFLAILIPLIGYQILKRLTDPFNAAAIAANYGSVSAVTFMTAVQFLDAQNVIYSGLTAAKNIAHLRGKSPLLVAYAVLAPIVHSLIALAIASALSLSLGDTLLLMVLAASASYIAVPAALKLAIPEATPSLYLGLSLGLTFPLNIILGIPFYFYLANLTRL